MKTSLILTLSLLLLSCGGTESPVSTPQEAVQTEKKPASPPSPSPSTRADEGQILFINSERVACTGVGPRTCLQTRSAESQDWQFFYNEIAGFDYEPGYTYQLRVKTSPVENPAADASSLKYTLLEVLHKDAVAAPVLSNTRWVYTGAVIDQVSQAVLADTKLTLNFADNDVSGSGGCNQFFGGYTQSGQQLTFKPLASTKRACLEPALNQQEQDFLTHLGEVTRLSGNADSLTLHLANNDQLRFTAAE